MRSAFYCKTKPQVFSAFSTFSLPAASACSLAIGSPVTQLMAFSPMTYRLPRLDIEPASSALLCN